MSHPEVSFLVLVAEDLDSAQHRTRVEEGAGGGENKPMSDSRRRLSQGLGQTAQKHIQETHIVYCLSVLVLKLQWVRKSLESSVTGHLALAGDTGNAHVSQTKMKKYDLTRGFSCILHLICPQKSLQFCSFGAPIRGSGNRQEGYFLLASVGPLVFQKRGQLLGKCPGVKIRLDMRFRLGWGSIWH